MDRQIIEISNENISLSLFRGFIVIDNIKDNTSKQIPLDNILSLIISANNTILSKNIINALCENGCNIIFCGKNYIPDSIVLSYVGHWLTSERVKQQIACSVPLRKNLWRFIVQSKIYNQALVLESIFPDSKHIERLKMLAKSTLSNDTKNNEGQAANIYFKALFGRHFIRDRASPDINILLNYTYTVLRAMVARAVAGNGLLPYLGLKHCQKSNTMPLVDDLIEPFRAVADRIVFEEVNRLANVNNIELTPDIKRRLSTIIAYPVTTEKGTIALSEAIYDFVGKLADSFASKKVKLSNPQII